MCIRIWLKNICSISLTSILDFVIVLEPDFLFHEVLAPYQPLAMKVSWFTFLSVYCWGILNVSYLLFISLLLYWHVVPWARPSPQPKGHLDRFSHFLLGSRSWQTDGPTEHTTSVTIGRIYIQSTAMWPNNTKGNNFVLVHNQPSIKT